jgi:hypothetical protein
VGIYPAGIIRPSAETGDSVEVVVPMRSWEKLNGGSDWRILAYGHIAAHTAVGSQLGGLG